MGPMIFLGISAITVTLALLYLIKRGNRKNTLANIARERAAEKSRLRSFADTQPLLDHISFVKKADVIDVYDTIHHLTDEEKAIIAAIMNNDIETIHMPERV